MNNNEIKPKTKEEILRDRLNVKLEQEFSEYFLSLQDLTKDEIITKSYETTCKEEIKDELKYMDLHEKEIVSMLGTEEVLHEFYHDWLDTDVPLVESMKDSILESVISVSKYYGKQNEKFVMKKDSELER